MGHAFNEKAHKFIYLCRESLSIWKHYGSYSLFDTKGVVVPFLSLYTSQPVINSKPLKRKADAALSPN